jgi:hypothetical protein
MRLFSLLLASAAFALLPLQAFAVSSNGGGQTDLAQAPQVGMYVVSATCGRTLSELQGVDITRSGFPKPTFNVNGAPASDIGDIAFDNSGNAWISFCGGNGFIEGYTHASLEELKKNPKRATPFAVLASNSLFCPHAAAFDQQGNLWTTDNNSDTDVFYLRKFASTALKAGGSVAPAVSMVLNGVNGPGRISFDPNGDLWVTDASLRSTFEFTATQIAQGGEIAPDLTLAPPNTSPDVLFAASDILFDSRGNMWVTYDSNATTSMVNEYAADDLNGSGTISPVPLTQIDPVQEGSAPASILGPSGLAFDSTGALWIANVGTGLSNGLRTGSIVKFNAAQLAFGIISPAPAIQLQAKIPKSGGCHKSIPFINPNTIVFGPGL